MHKCIVSLNGVETHGSEHETLQLAEAWYQSNLATGVFPSGHSVQYVDISEATAKALALAESEEAIALGASLMAEIRATNKMKLASGAMTEAQFLAMLSDATVSDIERALWNGSFARAKSLIQSLQQYYSTEEKNALIRRIDQFHSKWG